MAGAEFEICRLGLHDSYDELTEVLHRAYAPLAAQGMRFLASHQDAAMTKKRCSEGPCWVARQGGALVGTIVWRRGAADEECEAYRDPNVAIFGQFAVEPGLQGKGLGAKLLETAELSAQAEGCHEMACDTAEGALDLIATYVKWGYRRVGTVQWDLVNYRSVVLAKSLRRA